MVKAPIKPLAENDGDRGQGAGLEIEAVAHQPGVAHLIQIHALRRLERTADAAKELARAEEAALKLGQKEFFSSEFYLFYATLCEDLGYTDRSLEKIRKALALEPDDPVCANFLGYVLADRNRDLTEAERWVRLALTAEPDNFAYLDSIAWVHYRQQRFAEAMAEINRALRLAGREVDPVIFDHAGDIYAANGLWVLARKYWQDALSSGSHEAEKIRRKLSQGPVAGAAPTPEAGAGQKR